AIGSEWCGRSRTDGSVPTTCRWAAPRLRTRFTASAQPHRCRAHRQSGNMMRTAGDSVEQPPPLSRASTLPDDAAAASAFVAQSCAARMPRAARDQAVVGVVATAAYLSIAIFWLARGINAITGDEPHYLVAAHALVYNHSLDLRPVYGHGQWAGLGGGQFHTVDSGDAVLP